MYAGAAFVSGENIEACAREGVSLKGPLPGGPPSPGKITLASFSFYAQRQRVLRPLAGHSPVRQGLGRKGRDFVATFFKTDCMHSPLSSACPTQELKNSSKLYWRPAKVTSSRRRIEQQLREFKEEYRIRSGLEATNSELKRAHGMGQLRVSGRPSVELAVFLKALACNSKRYLKYTQNQLKHAQNRVKKTVSPSFDLNRVKFLLKTASVSAKRPSHTAKQHDLPFRPLI